MHTEPSAPPAAPERMPTVYIPHGGGPCFFMEWQPRDAWDTMAAYLRGIVERLPRRPRAIVMVSAHWLESGLAVTGGARPGLIYDYYGFPPHTYTLQYPAPGEPALARQVAALAGAAGFAPRIDEARGFDHGMFIPLLLMVPQADIPVVQLSLDSSLDAGRHVALGRALQPLRDEDVLIVGSGMSFHNMRGYGDPRFGPVSDTFDAWLSATVAATPAERDAGLTAWEQAPMARACHPPRAEEHLLPLMVVAGAAGQDRGQREFSDHVMETRISAYRFG